MRDGETRGGRQPTPVREAFERERELPPEPPPPRRELTGPDGGAWVVELVGRGRARHRGDVGAPLVLLRFTPAGDADEPETPAEGVREALVVARELEEIPEAKLLEVLQEAGPPEFEPSELFPGTRRKG